LKKSQNRPDVQGLSGKISTFLAKIHCFSFIKSIVKMRNPCGKESTDITQDKVKFCLFFPF